MAKFSDEQLHMSPAIGESILLTEPIPTFGGPLAGEFTISGVIIDRCGETLVNLSRRGCLVVTGAAWPLACTASTKADEVVSVSVESSELICPPQQYGLVVIVDFMNLLVKAFHAPTAPSRIHAVKSMLLTCANIIEKLSPEYLIFAADGGHAERSAAFSDYKAHRPPKPTELIEQIALGEQAITAIGWPMIRVRDWEADDVIASLATSIGPRSAGVVIASCDKDLFQLCEEGKRVKIYHPWDGGKFLGGTHVEEKYGIKRGQFADYLALVGDKSDGIPGVPGIGPKKAAELLTKYPDLSAVLEAGRCLQVPGAVGKALKEQAELARMSRQLVELHRGLVIPSTWHDNPASSPAAGWVETLRKLDLGAAANRLCDVLPATGRVRSHPSLIEVKHDQPRLAGETVLRDCGDVPPHTAGGDRSEPTSRPIDEDTERPSRRTAGDVAAVEVVQQVAESKLAVSVGTGARLWQSPGYIPHEQRVADALSDAISRDVTCPDWIVKYPPLSVLPPECHAEIKCRSTYAHACSRKFGAEENPFRPGSDVHFVFELATRGEPFAMPLEQATKPAGPKSLF